MEHMLGRWFYLPPPDELSPTWVLDGIVPRRLTWAERIEFEENDDPHARFYEVEFIDGTKLGDGSLLTSFFGWSEALGGDDLLLFETSLTIRQGDSPRDEVVARYATLRDAFEGHQHWLRWFFLSSGRLLPSGS